MRQPELTWLDEATEFPEVHTAWGDDTPMPGLLAAGGLLNAHTLARAYQRGIFPWFSPGQPHLWWSPDPRMVLKTADFKIQPSLRKTLRKFARQPGFEVRIDHDFRQIITHCAHTPRHGQNGTWIVPDIINAYCDLHEQGLAHSVETWVHGELVGGLYCVAIGRAVYGESMFAHATDASKVALAALVGLCRHHGATQIDCQQATAHLASLGAKEQSRHAFLEEAAQQQQRPAMHWQWNPLYWNALPLGLTDFTAHPRSVSDA